MDLYYQMHLLTEFLEPPTNMSWYRELSASQDDEPVRKGKKKYFSSHKTDRSLKVKDWFRALNTAI